ncbi:MAG: ParB/RepB/Spo0J family partition protein [Thermoguttaceae bacterium]|nr:ParB/RepB/Spo0J family partition protein [Thermoguttaceae bacterium]
MSKDNKRLGRGLEALLRNVAAAQSSAEKFESPEDAVLETAGSVSTNRETFPSIVPFSAKTSENGSVEGDEAASRKLSDAARLEERKDEALAQFSNGRVPVEIDVDLIDRNPFQPRLDFDEAELEELKASLKTHGLIQPIVARKKDERYELVAGERRFRAAQDSGWKKIPAVLIVASDREMAEIALTENMQRRDLNPIEKALAFRNYLDAYGGTREDLARRLSLDRSTVSNLIRLLDLNEEVQTMARAGELSMGHARALLPLDLWDQLEMAKRVVAEQLSVRQTEEIVKEYVEGDALVTVSKPKRIAEVSPRVQELEQQFRSWLGMRVKLTSNDKGKGKLVVQFNSNDEFERIYQALKPR